MSIPPARPLIPRRTLFGNPERSLGVISPNGRWLGYLAPVDGVLEVWVGAWAPGSDQPGDAKPVTRDGARGIRTFQFAEGDRLLYLQDEGGDENYRVYLTDLATGATTPLTPAGARAEIVALSPTRPDEVLVQVNARDPQYFDLVAIDLATGASRTVLENDRFAGFVVDQQHVAQAAVVPTPDGGMDTYLRGADGAFELWEHIPFEDALTTAPVSLSADGRTLYLLDSRDRNTGAMYAYDVQTKVRTLVYEDARADVSQVLLHPETLAAQAVAVEVHRVEWAILDPAIAPDLQRIRDAVGPRADIDVVSRSRDDGRWVVTAARPDASTRYYLYDRRAGSLTTWFDVRPALAGLPLAPMVPVDIPTRDGLELVGYLTLPLDVDPDRTGVPTRPVPLVLHVHGGPWARDHYKIDPVAIWLADRGFAVLAVNFRGSIGFGKAFVNAGDLEWGRKMHDDLLDAVAFAVARGITRPDTVGIVGGSYGGYAALVGLTFTPDVFACGVSIVGPSSLVTLLSSIPPYWGPMKAQFTQRVGDDGTEEGRALLTARSPLTFVDRITRPLLIVQGANDPRVKVAESDQIVAAMQAKGLPVTYLLYPDEGHGFARPENNRSSCAVIEAFLGRVFGTPVEPIGADFEGSSIQVPAGAELLPGLAPALKRRADPAPTGG